MEYNCNNRDERFASIALDEADKEGMKTKKLIEEVSKKNDKAFPKPLIWKRYKIEKN